MHASRDPAIALRITPPKLRRSLLVRKRIDALRARLASMAVVLVEAPAGFGKTLALAQWRADWLREGALVAWLSVDADDDASRIVAGLVESLRHAADHPAMGGSVPDPAAYPGGYADAITALLAEIAETPRVVVLICDDADRATDPDVHALFAYLFNNAPDNLRILVGTRAPLAVDSRELIAHGALWRVGSKELCFDLAETIEFVAARFGGQVDSDTCARLHEISGGWPMGLQLAVTAIERAESVATAAYALTAHTDLLARDLLGQAIQSMPADMVDFLVECAILEALHPSLCEALTGNERAAEYLHRLVAETPLATPGEGTEWVRLHALARDYFCERARALPSSLLDQLHGRAEHWLAAHGQPAQAADHAYAAGHTERWMELIGSCLYDLLLKGQLGLLGDWCARLPPQVFDQYPAVRIAAAWGFAIGERPALARQQLAPLLQREDLGPETRDEVILIMASAALLEDDLDATGAWLGRLSSHDLSSNHPLLVGVYGGLMAYLAIHEGATERARYYLLRASNARIAAANVAYREFFVGISYLWEGRATLAEGILFAAHQRFERDTGRRGVLTTMIGTALAAACWDRGAATEARALLANRLDMVERCALPSAVVLGFQTQARLALADGDEARALSLLEELAVLGEVRGIVRFEVASLAERVRIHAGHRRAAQCKALLARLEARVEAGQASATYVRPLFQLQVAMARVYGAYAAGDRAAMASTIDAAEPLARQFNRGRELVQLLALRAVLVATDTAAERLLQESLSLAVSGGLAQAYADTLPVVVAEVDAYQRAHEATPRSPAMANTFATAPIEPARPPARPGTPASAASVAILTPKEYEVLCLLASRLPNKRIAEALDVSGETVKWHLKNLFSKLNAGSREHAVHRARMLGIL